MSCLFPVHQAVQVRSRTSPALRTARAAHSRGFALEPRPSVSPHALSPCCNSHLKLLCCCPEDSAGAGRRSSGDQPFPRHHEALTNRGSCSRPPGHSAWFDTHAPFPCPPQPLAAPKHGWVSLPPHPAGTRTARPSCHGGFCTGTPRKGPEGPQRGGMKVLGWSLCLL